MINVLLLIDLGVVALVLFEIIGEEIVEEAAGIQPFGLTIWR